MRIYTHVHARAQKHTSERTHNASVSLTSTKSHMETSNALDYSPWLALDINQIYRLFKVMECV